MESEGEGVGNSRFNVSLISRTSPQLLQQQAALLGHMLPALLQLSSLEQGPTHSLCGWPAGVGYCFSTALTAVTVLAPWAPPLTRPPARPQSHTSLSVFPFHPISARWTKHGLYFWLCPFFRNKLDEQFLKVDLYFHLGGSMQFLMHHLKICYLHFW